MKNVTNDNGDDKAVLPISTLLAAAHDANDAVLLAQALLADERTTLLAAPTIKRMFAIGYSKAQPTRCEVQGMRQMVSAILDSEIVQ